MADIFCELLSMKEPETTLQNKGTNVKTPRRAQGSRLRFNCTGKIGINTFGCLNSSFSLFCFYFVTNLRKKLYGRVQLKLPLTPIWASTLLAGPILPLRMYIFYGWSLARSFFYFQAKISLLYSIYVLFCLKCNYFWCEIFLIQR